MQIKQMEERMEKLVKEKEEAVKKANIPMDVFPLTTVSITTVSASSTIATTSTTEGDEQLAESVKNLPLNHKIVSILCNLKHNLFNL